MSATGTPPAAMTMTATSGGVRQRKKRSAARRAALFRFSGD
jgi:hypothetical protein